MKKITWALLVAATAGCGLFNSKPADEGKHGDGGQPTPQSNDVDPSTLDLAPTKLPICADAKVGWLVERTTDLGGMTLTERYAVVGDTGDSWRVEARNQALEAMTVSYQNLQGMLLGLTVKKSDGTVTKAVIGKPGEPGKPARFAASSSGQTEAPQSAPDRVSIGALGTREAIKTTHPGGLVTWTGTTGDYKGLLLKSQGPGADYELTAPPTKDSADVGGVSVSFVAASYSNGWQQAFTTHEVVACLTGTRTPDGVALFRAEIAGTRTAVTAIKADAKPQLAW
jgi:hypothetical protein